MRSLLIAATLGSSARTQATQASDWENPEPVGDGTEPPDCTLLPCPVAETARMGTSETPPSFKLLSGRWKLHGAHRPAQADSVPLDSRLEPTQALIPPGLELRNEPLQAEATNTVDPRVVPA